MTIERIANLNREKDECMLAKELVAKMRRGSPAHCIKTWDYIFKVLGLRFNDIHEEISQAARRPGENEQQPQRRAVGGISKTHLKKLRKQKHIDEQAAKREQQKIIERCGTETSPLEDSKDDQGSKNIPWEAPEIKELEDLYLGFHGRCSAKDRDLLIAQCLNVKFRNGRTAKTVSLRLSLRGILQDVPWENGDELTFRSEQDQSVEAKPKPKPKPEKKKRTRNGPTNLVAWSKQEDKYLEERFKDLSRHVPKRQAHHVIAHELTLKFGNHRTTGAVRNRININGL